MEDENDGRIPNALLSEIKNHAEEFYQNELWARITLQRIEKFESSDKETKDENTIVIVTPTYTETIKTQEYEKLDTDDIRLQSACLVNWYDIRKRFYNETLSDKEWLYTIATMLKSNQKAYKHYRNVGAAWLTLDSKNENYGRWLATNEIQKDYNVYQNKDEDLNLIFQNDLKRLS